MIFNEQSDQNDQNDQSDQVACILWQVGRSAGRQVGRSRSQTDCPTIGRSTCGEGARAPAYDREVSIPAELDQLQIID